MALVGGPLLASLGCGTVELGDNIIPPEVRVDEDRYYCDILPNVIRRHGCATGQTAECDGSSCHSSASAFRLHRPTDYALPECAGGRPVGMVDEGAREDYLQTTLVVGPESLASPFYLRPTGSESHPCRPFERTSDSARLVADWIDRGAL